MIKLTLELAEQCFKEGNCKLLEKKYIGALHKMRYKCSCGNISEISLANFKQGQRCKICGHKRTSEKQALTLEYVEQYFKDHGGELLEKIYKNTNIKIRYRCSCGNISKTTFSNFQQGKRCEKCGGREKFTLEYVEQYFEKQKCKLLEKEYINNSTKMKYRCSCGDISKITFNHFKKGQRCMKCASKSRSGENNHNYNSDLTDEEREKNKNRTTKAPYRRWRLKIYKKNHFVCQKCFQKGKYLNAHHIASWRNNKKIRLNKNNGITFCEDCHKEYHKEYGYKNSNGQQLDKFLKGKKENNV